MTTVITKATKLLEQELRSLGASSSTFYVRDPWWSTEFRLLLMPGVLHQEPMHGLILPSEAKRVISVGRADLYFPNVVGKRQLRPELSPDEHWLAERNPLFGDFVQREQVQSCARFLLRGGRQVEASLFINFTEKKVFTKQLKDSMKEVSRKLFRMLPDFRDHLKKENAFPQLVQILQPIEHLSSLKAPLNVCLKELLKAIFKAFHLNVREDIGTIHLFEPEAGILRLVCSRGKIDKLRRKQHLKKGEGVISWVGVKKRAILIGDLSVSGYRHIHMPIRSNARSELALPMLAGDRLLGVLNIESERSARFSSEMLRTVWCAANIAAITCQLSLQVKRHKYFQNLTQALFQVGKDAITSGAHEPEHALNLVASVAGQWLKASMCEIWQYDEIKHKFSAVGVNYSSFRHGSGPRPEGWSQFVLDNDITVLLDEIASEDEFKPFRWDATERTWKMLPHDEGPSTVFREYSRQRMKRELAIPIRLRGHPMGVAWLKYSHQELPLPSSELVRSGLGFAGQAGLVIEILKSLSWGKSLEFVGRPIGENLFRSGRLELPCLDCYVLSRPVGTAGIGGDFYAGVKLDENTAGFLIGDARDKEIRGALHMLPMITAFKAFHGESRSTKYILEKLNRVTNAMGSTGTALYATIGPFDNKKVLFASNAGHPPLMIFQGDDINLFPGTGSTANGGMLGSREDLFMGEAGHQVEPGDLIVGFTDGITEAGAVTIRGREFGGRGIQRAVLRTINGSPQEIAEGIFEDASSHAKNNLHDDITIFVARVL